MADAIARIDLSHTKIKSILHDFEKSAKAVDLVYVQDNQPGIARIKKGKSFQYSVANKPLKDSASLERIKKLVIPPAWQDVWICKTENGHLQATGIDIKNRKQYKYHPLWSALRNQTKFYRLYEFGKVLPIIRQKLKSDLSLPGLPVEKILATVLLLMEQTSIRVGNEAYEKLYGSFGLTTLKNRHVSIAGDQLQFAFKGKKGISHNISIKNKKLAKIVSRCKDIPGKELFQYYDVKGNHKTIDSGMVNAYIKEISGEYFTAKDFRTWAGTAHSIKAFSELGVCDTPTENKSNIISVLDCVAKHLGNTRSVCKKYYVHPLILNLYENNKLQKYLAKLDSLKSKVKSSAFTAEEKLLMMILEKEGFAGK